MDSKVVKSHIFCSKSNIIKKSIKTRYGTTIFNDLNLFPEKSNFNSKCKSINESRNSNILTLVLESHDNRKGIQSFASKKDTLTFYNDDCTIFRADADVDENGRDNCNPSKIEGNGNVILTSAKKQHNHKDEYYYNVDDPNITTDRAYNYLLELDSAQVPSEENLTSYSNLRQSRDLLLNWLVKIHNNMHLESETLYITFKIVDNYLMKKEVLVGDFQLIGITALYIAAKYEEVLTPTIFQFSLETDGLVHTEDIKSAEIDILEIINFKLSFPSPLAILEKQFPAQLSNFEEVTRMATFLLEIMLIDFRFLCYNISDRATASILVALRMYNQTISEMTEKLKKENNIARFETICKNLIQYLVEPEIHPELIKKFKSASNFFVAEKAIRFIRFLSKKNG